jgi:hypothetical protein
MVITLELVGNTSIADIDSQVVIMGQLRIVVNQLINNVIALNSKIKSKDTIN